MSSLLLPNILQHPQGILELVASGLAAASPKDASRDPGLLSAQRKRTGCGFSAASPLQ